MQTNHKQSSLRGDAPPFVPAQHVQGNVAAPSAPSIPTSDVPQHQQYYGQQQYQPASGHYPPRGHLPPQSHYPSQSHYPPQGQYRPQEPYQPQGHYYTPSTIPGLSRNSHNVGSMPSFVRQLPEVDCTGFGRSVPVHGGSNNPGSRSPRHDREAKLYSSNQREGKKGRNYGNVKTAAKVEAQGSKEAHGVKNTQDVEEAQGAEEAQSVRKIHGVKENLSTKTNQDAEQEIEKVDEE